jgi:FdhD protein
VNAGEVVLAPSRSRASAVRVVSLDAGTARRRRDVVATEEPLEIRAAGPGQPARSIAVTMRTPGHDFELAAGFLLSEGLVPDGSAIRAIRYCELEPGQEQRFNVVTAELAVPVTADAARATYMSSSCGVCGKASIDGLEVRCAPLAAGPRVAPSVLASLPDALREAQRVFDRTGGLHAAGLFATDGRLLAAREDVGRHNALDKLLGRAALDGDLPLAQRIVLVSGRASFELVQKSAVAGVPVLCAVSAPSSLAVDTARRLGVTLVGFLRGERMNVYAHAERVDVQAAA